MRHFSLCAFVMVLGLANAFYFPSAKGTSQAGKSATQDKSNNEKPSTPTPNEPGTAQSAFSILRGSQQFPADYIPCVFTQGELLGLRLAPESPTLTSADDDNLRQNILSEATFQASISTLTPDQKRLFFDEVTRETFVGLTPSQAVALVLQILRSVGEEPARVNALVNAAKRDWNQLQETAIAQIRFIGDEKFDFPIQIELKQSPIEGTQAQSEEAESKQELARDRLLQLASNASRAQAVLRAQAARAKRSINTDNDLYNLSNDLDRLARVASEAAEEVTPTTTKTGGTEEAQTSASKKAQQAIVETARQTIVAFQRPNDVGCAMSLLSWNETRYAFGSLIAREYIAVQIVVRNLNDKEDFALHDAELSVDSDINGRYSRFYSGRDKVVVRGLALAQQNTNKRNLIVHSAEAVGTLMSAVIPVAGAMFADAAGVYNGGFLPGLRSVWPDLSVTQLNLLNDVGFSSSTNYKTVVPKSGSIMFVIFVPSKQYENGWWTQKCAEGVTQGNLAGGASPGAPSSKLGIDLSLARSLCSTNQKRPANPVESSQPSAPTSGTESRDSKKENQQEPLTLKPVHYKDWSPSALAIFRELAFAVVAGTHIQEESQKQPALSQLSCPADSTGKVQIPSDTATTAISCDLTGQNLDKVASLRLRNLDDPTDPQSAEGTVSISGDPTKGKVAFTVAKLGTLEKPNYKVFLVTSAGVEMTSEQVVHLDLIPIVQKVAPESENLSSTEKMQFTLTGFHLNRIEQIQLFEKSAQTPSVKCTPAPSASVGQMSFTISASDDDLKKKAQQKDGVVLTVAFVSKDSGSAAVTTKTQITLTASVSNKTNPQQPPGGQQASPSGTQKGKPLQKEKPSKQDHSH